MPVLAAGTSGTPRVAVQSLSGFMNMVAVAPSAAVAVPLSASVAATAKAGISPPTSSAVVLCFTPKLNTSKHQVLQNVKQQEVDEIVCILRCPRACDWTLVSMSSRFGERLMVSSIRLLMHV